MAAKDFEEDFHDCLTDSYFQSNLSAGSEDSNSNICDPCFSDNVQREAKGFCFDCNEYLCDNCLRLHRRFGAFRDHDVLKGDSMPVKKQTDKNKCVFKFCEDHRMSEVQFYCHDDDSVFCGLCKQSKHSVCNTQPITDTEKDKKPAELSDLYLKVQSMKSEFENLKEKYFNKIGKIKVITQTYKDQVNKIKQDVENDFQKLERQVDASIVDTPIPDLAENLWTCEEAIRYLLSTKEHSERVKDSSDYIAKFAADVKLRKMFSVYIVLQTKLPFKEEIVISQEILQKIAELQQLSVEIKETILPKSKCHENVAKNKEPTTRNFQNAYVQVDLHDSIQTNCSNVEVPPAVESKSPTGSISIQPETDDSDRKVSEFDKSDTGPAFECHQIKLNYFINVNHNENCPSSITGSTILPTGHIVLCDNASCVLLLLDNYRGVCDKMKVTPAPWEVTIANGKTLYVTQPEAKQYKQITVEDGKFKEETTTILKRKCWGIDAYRDKIAISYHDTLGKGQIEVRFNTGQKIEDATFTLPNRELVRPSHLKANQTNGNIYVTDTISQTLVCFSIKGQFLWIIENKAFGSPGGLALDGCGNCLVCVKSTKKLMLVKEKQENPDEIWSESDIFRMWCKENRVPQTVAVNWDDLTVVVGHKNKNHIQILKLYCPI